MIEKIPPILKNKYVLTVICFLFWLTFFDDNNLITQIENKMELDDLQDEKGYYVQEIKKTQKDLHELTTDLNNLERFAREKYLMKKSNEEVFVFAQE